LAVGGAGERHDAPGTLGGAQTGGWTDAERRGN